MLLINAEEDTRVSYQGKPHYIYLNRHYKNKHGFITMMTIISF